MTRTVQRGKPVPRFRGVIAGSLRAAGIVILLAGIGWGCYTTFLWLQTGEWQALLLEPLVVRWAPAAMRDWIGHPHSWYGLHVILVWLIRIPLLAFMALLGFLIVLVSS